MKKIFLVLPVMVFLFSTLSHASQPPNLDLYRFYFSETLNKHLRGGLVAQIESCRSLNYRPCKNRFDGFKFQSTSEDTALFLATLAKDYSLGIHPKAQTLTLIHQTLDAYDRLSRYSTEQSQFLVSQIYQQNISQMSIEFLLRKPLIQQMTATGFLIREDLGEDYDRFASTVFSSPDKDAFQNVNPTEHDLISVLFGLVTVKKYVDDQAVRYKVGQLAERIFDYLTTNNFQIKSPKTFLRFKGKTKLKNSQYPILVALRYLIDTDSLKPKDADLAGTRFDWVVSSAFELEFLRFRCDENLPARKIRTGGCDYKRAVDKYLMAALASFETDEKLLEKNKSFFKKKFLHKKRISKEQNPLLAAIALDFFEVPLSIELAAAVQNLATAPAQSLPNSWAKPWKRVFQKPMSFVKNQQLLAPDSNSETGLEFPGTDYLMPLVYSAFHQ